MRLGCFRRLVLLLVLPHRYRAFVAVLKLAAGSSTPDVLPFTGVYCPGGLAVDSAGTVYVVVGDASVPATKSGVATVAEAIAYSVRVAVSLPEPGDERNRGSGLSVQPGR